MAKPVPQSYPFTWRWTHKQPGPAEVEQKLKQIIDGWMAATGTGAKKKEEDKYADALKEALKKFLKDTPAGKKLTELLTSNDVLPLTLMILGGALTGILVNKRDIPSSPDIPLGKSIIVNVDFEGNISNPKKIFIKFSMPIGSVERKKTPQKAAAAIGVPPKVASKIKRVIDDNALRSWIIKQAAWEYEIAGPTEEERKLLFRNWVRNPKNRGELPSTHELANYLAAKIHEAAKGKRREAIVRLTDERIWPAITDLTGLWKRLDGLVVEVVRLLGSDGRGVMQVRFEYPRTRAGRGKWNYKWYPIQIKSAP